MIIRRIKPEELKRTQELFSVAFEYPMDNTKSAQEVFEETTANPKTREDLSWENHFAAFQDDDVTLMSALCAIPYPVVFDGGQCEMIGVGGVSTFPQYRRSGGIRGCFEQALPWMRESGAVFSYLYPFSTAYYRKFGYEIACRRRQYKLAMDKLPKFRAQGDCYLLERGADLKADIQAVYQAWQERYNMMVAGESYEFAWVDAANPPKDQEFTYVYKSREQVPMGYVTYRKGEENGRAILKCRRFHFTCLEGLTGLLALLHTLSADHAYLHFHLPEDMDLMPVLPEWSMGAVSMEMMPFGMVRVVNVEKALEMADIPGNGVLRVAITDEQIQENCGVFQVEYHEGEPNKVSRTAQSPDAQMDIAGFSALLLGVHDTKAISFMQNVTAFVPLEALSPLFHKKDVFICEYF